ncbi:hypothetical protein L218DRAFT_884309, partial [Marasmius fiardii PR-910]
SYDESGQVPTPHNECDYFGLPTKLLVQYCLTYKFLWPTKTCENVCKWQVVRGLDPSTIDFTHYCEFPVYKVMHPESN